MQIYAKIKITLNMLSTHITFNIYHKLSWYHLKDILLRNNNIANSNIIWQKHFVDLFGEVQTTDVKHKFLTRLNKILNDYIVDVEYNESDAEYGIYEEYELNKLFDNYWFSLICVGIDGFLLESLNDQYRQDQNIVMTAVNQNGNALQYASNDLKNDKEIVMTAVQQDGYALRYASNDLKNDKEIVMTAVQQDGYALQYVGNELRNDREIVLIAVEQNGECLGYVSDKLRSDKEIILMALRQNKYAVRHIANEMLKDEEIALEAMKTGLLK
jgi:Domain of unknown function (DUF4116)